MKGCSLLATVFLIASCAGSSLSFAERSAYVDARSPVYADMLAAAQSLTEVDDSGIGDEDGVRWRTREDIVETYDDALELWNDALPRLEAIEPPDAAADAHGDLVDQLTASIADLEDVASAQDAPIESLAEIGRTAFFEFDAIRDRSDRDLSQAECGEPTC